MKEDIRILFIRMSSLGDIIHTLPTLYAIRKQYPKAYIAWAVHERFKDIIPGKPWVDEIILIDKKRLKRLPYLIELWGQLHKKKFDISLDLQSLAKSAAVAGVSGAKKKYSYCEQREGSWIVNTPLVGSHCKGHVVDRYLDTARALGCAMDEVVFPLPSSDIAKEQTLQRLQEAGISAREPYIVIAPGARWIAKEWPLTKFTELCQELVKLDQKVVLVRAADDIPKGQTIVEGVGHPNVVSLIGDTHVHELIEVIRHSALYISADTGPLHIASALQIPLIALFGTTCAERTGPYGEDHVHLIVSPTSRATIDKPLVEDMECMDQISVETVLAQVKEMRNL